jgi:hypothetical protein
MGNDLNGVQVTVDTQKKVLAVKGLVRGCFAASNVGSYCICAKHFFRFNTP